jgi:hypothetical protein
MLPTNDPSSQIPGECCLATRRFSLYFGCNGIAFVVTIKEKKSRCLMYVDPRVTS